jgi:hypothetical protein
MDQGIHQVVGSPQKVALVQIRVIHTTLIQGPVNRRKHGN